MRDASAQGVLNETNEEHKKIIPEGFFLFITLFGNLILIVPVILMGIMHGISIGFLEGMRKMVTMYETIIDDGKTGE